MAIPFGDLRGHRLGEPEDRQMESLALGKFDIVFCRNVLIYFDSATKSKVLDGMSRLLPHDGVLFLGGAETVLGVTDRFQPMPGQRGVYALADSVDAMRRAAV